MPLLKKTKIVATLGPASENKEVLEKMMLAGTNVFRINFSHAAEQIRGIKIHGTPISLRKYCLIFIYFSPFLYNSQLVVTTSETGYQLESIVSLMFSLVVSFVLMALYNVQDYIENPFDQEGLDDLNIEAMKVNEWESLYTDDKN